MNRKKMGIFIYEQQDGKVAFEMYSDTVKGKKLFDNFQGNSKEERATFIIIDWENNKSEMETKKLPDLGDKSDEPWGYRLGDGPIFEPPSDDEKI